MAEHQYAVSQAASEALLSLAATASGATWTRPVGELAAEALAFVDGVTLRWLVDGDGAAARARLDAFSAYLAGSPSRRAGAVARAARGRAMKPGVSITFPRSWSVWLTQTDHNWGKRDQQPDRKGHDHDRP